VNGDVPTTDSAEVIHMNAFDVKDVNGAAYLKVKLRRLFQ
jgi:hypothetical protein